MSCCLDKNEKFCPCSQIIFPPALHIPAGLSHLPRQLANFSEFRAALLNKLRKHKIFSVWKGASVDDFNVMFCEMWAYVCDVFCFYDELISHESYVGTAKIRDSLRKLVGLLGYIPRPAQAALASLAMLAEGNEFIQIPKGTAFRSGGFAEEPPQVFEAEETKSIHPFNSSWNLIPQEKYLMGFNRSFSSEKKEIYFDARSCTINKDDMLILINSSQNTVIAKSKVTEVNPFTDRYGFSYKRVCLDAGFTLRTPIDVRELRVFKALNKAPVDIEESTGKTICLDRLYRDINIGAPILFEYTSQGSFKKFARIQSIFEDEIEKPRSIGFTYETLKEKKPHILEREKPTRWEPTLSIVEPQIVMPEPIASTSWDSFTGSISDVGAEIVDTEDTSGSAGFFDEVADILEDAVDAPGSPEAFGSLSAGEADVLEGMGGPGVRSGPLAEDLREEIDIGTEYVGPKRTDLFYFIKVPVTKLTLSDGFRGFNKYSSGVLYYNLQPAGTVKIKRPDTQQASEPWQITSPPPIFRGEVPVPVQFLFSDHYKKGLESGGNVDETNKTFDITVETGNDKECVPPVTAYGNLLKISRGQTVSREILGSGDAVAANQRFKLKNKPLTYLPEFSTANAQRTANTLKVWVNDILWKEVAHFYGQPYDARVYIVRQDNEGESFVIFGDGINGARLPTGQDNIIASYRYGAGASVPPAHSITQMAKPINGITGVCNPLSAYGGRDAESKENLRENAPHSALLLGRAVSLIDMQTVTARENGVKATKAEWCWDKELQRPAVVVWYIGAEQLTPLLVNRLKNSTDPTTPISVRKALPVDVSLRITLDIYADYYAPLVKEEVLATLINPKTGMLDPENVGIGEPLFRSSLFAAILSVDGVENVSSVLWNGSRLTDFVRKPETGHYFNFENRVNIL